MAPRENTIKDFYFLSKPSVTILFFCVCVSAGSETCRDRRLFWATFSSFFSAQNNRRWFYAFLEKYPSPLALFYSFYIITVNVQRIDKRALYLSKRQISFLNFECSPEVSECIILAFAFTMGFQINLEIGFVALQGREICRKL